MRPGVFDVRASALRLASALSSELLPTFERPAKAISGTVGIGQELQPRRRFQELDRPREQLAGALGQLVLVRVPPSRRHRMRCRTSAARSFLYSHHCCAIVRTLLVTQ